MEQKTLSGLHCIFFIYNCFASATDGELAKEEAQEIQIAMNRWVGGDQKKTKTIIDETMDWQKNNVKTGEEWINHMASMIHFLKEPNNDFGMKRREYFLVDIRNIARADGKFLDGEKYWHDMMAEILEVNIRISSNTASQLRDDVNSVKRTNIGFQRN